MVNTNNSYVTDNEESESKVPKFYYLRSNDELYDEDENVAHPIIRIKRINKQKNKERWEITKNNKVAFVLYSNQLTKADKKLLCTPSGVDLLMSLFKAGGISVNKVKTSLRNYRKEHKC